MATYTVKDSQTNKTITFNWNGEAPPTEKDMEEVFAEAYRQSPQTNVESALSKVQAIKQDYPVRRKILSLVRPMVEYGLMAAGGAGGGLIGTPGGPIGVGAGAVTGGGLGYSAGSGLMDAIEEVAGVRKPTPYGNTMKGRLDKAGRDFLTGTAMEAGGQVMGKVAGGLLKDIAPISKEASKVNDIAQKENIRYTPADIRQTKGESLIETVLFNAPLSATRAQQAKLNTIKDLTAYRQRLLNEYGSPELIETVGMAVQKNIDDIIGANTKLKTDQLSNIRNGILSRMGSNETYESMGLGAKQILESRSASATAKKNIIYSEVAKAIPEEKYQFSNMNKVAEEELQKVLSLPDQDQRLVGVLKWASEKGKLSPQEQAFMEQIKILPPDMQKQAIAQSGIDPGKFVSRGQDTFVGFRGKLNQLIKESDEAVKQGAPGLKGQGNPASVSYKKLKAALDADFEQAAKDTGGEVWDKLQAANEYYAKEYSPVWKAQITKKMAYTKPDKLMDLVFRPNNVSEIKIAQKALGEDGFNLMKRRFTQKLFDEAGDFNQMQKTLTKYGDSINAIYKPEEIKMIRDAMTTGLRIERSPVMEKYFVDLAKSLEKRPEKIVDYIVRPNNIESIRKAKTILKPETWNQVEEKLLEKLMVTNKEIAGEGAGFISPAKFETEMFKMGDDTLRAALKPDRYNKLQELKLLSKYAQTAEKQAGNPSGTAQNVITWSTGAMVVGDPITGMAVAIAPNIFARLYFSPTGFKLFTKGIKMPYHTPQGIELASKLSAIIAKDQNRNEKFEEITQPEGEQE